MDTNLLQRHFSKIGARLKIESAAPRRNSLRNASVLLDIQRDKLGEFFELRVAPAATSEVEVLQTQPSDQHLLLLVREDGDKSKFLCGHDERHWFVAAIPESAAVGTVTQAKDSLKPAPVRRAEAATRVRGKARQSRKNAAFVRQGEWFFLPAPRLQVDAKSILRNEPLSRGNGSKAHWVDECYRYGGESVYVCSRHPAGLSTRTYAELLSRKPSAAKWDWREMKRNASVFVRGRIRHADHQTITLHDWHQVQMNTENQSQAMRNVAFLD